MRWRSIAVGLLSSCVVLGLPAPSSAAVVSVLARPAPEPLPEATRPGDPTPALSRSMDYKLLVQDRAGARNDLTIRETEGRARVRDTRTRLRAGRGCKHVDRHTATCVRPRFSEIGIQTRRGDDSVSVSSDAHVGAALGPGDDVFMAGALSSAVFADGGAGDDILSGSRFGDALDGHRGRDVLIGRGGDDELEQRDTTRRHDSDILDGGPGVDEVGYRYRTASVNVDLERIQGQGERGENDLITGVENVRGSSAGGDVLKGDAEDNYLDAQSGRGDTIVGRRGDDYIWSAKRVSAGPGRDTVIYGQRGSHVSCGIGFDDVTEMAHNGRNIYDADCERIGLAGEDGNYRSLVPLRSPRALVGRFRAGCREGHPCDVTLALRAVSASGAVGPRIGRTHATVPYGSPRTMRLRLSPRGRELLRGRRHPHARVSVRIVQPRSRFESRGVTRDRFETTLR